MILVPTDFSELSVQAINYAKILAKQLNKKILLLNSFEIPPSTSTSVADMSMLLSKQSEEDLNDFKNRYFQSFSDVLTYSYYGSLVNAFEKVTNEFVIDFAVMSTSGDDSFFNKLFGSQTSSMLSVNNFPLVILPEGVNFSNINNITLACDLSVEINYPSLSFIYSLFDKEVIHYNVISIVDEIEKFEIRDSIKKQIEVKLGESKTTFLAIESNDVFDALNNYVLENNSDLLIMFEKNYGFIEGLFHQSLTKKMTLKSKKPLIILPSL